MSSLMMNKMFGLSLFGLSFFGMLLSPSECLSQTHFTTCRISLTLRYPVVWTRFATR